MQKVIVAATSLMVGRELTLPAQQAFRQRAERQIMGENWGVRSTEVTSWAKAIILMVKMGWDRLVPPTRIERATRGLGIKPGQFLKRSVYQMVSPF